jgi:hypothetical protein
VIARRSRRASLLRVAEASSGFVALAFLRTHGLLVPALVLAAGGVVALARALRAWSLPHTIELDRNGVWLAWSEPVTALPWVRRRSREVPWASLQSVEALPRRMGGLRPAALLVRTTVGAFEVPVCGLDRSAPEVARAILDARTRLEAPPPPQPSAFAVHAASRFSTPVVLTQRASTTLGMGVISAVVIGLAASLASTAPSWLTIGLMGLVSAMFGAIELLLLASWWGQRVVELRADGIAIGPTRASARLHTWDSVREVRRQHLSMTTTGVELLLSDGTRTALSGDYGRSWESIAVQIDPHEHGA